MIVFLDAIYFHFHITIDNFKRPSAQYQSSVNHQLIQCAWLSSMTGAIIYRMRMKQKLRVKKHSEGITTIALQHNSAKYRRNKK